ncbi:hypothetical protein [Leuconostoc citreum]|uniref:hypothetical protein n=1 Tax=Leuconostoc citreum TaxID=33964 RepID=UPI0020A0BCEB|nr:hypothetical protein [Leuconostoc citreum]MCP1275110.1 hypothetical protein [Leuconostoc citreum]
MKPNQMSLFDVQVLNRLSQDQEVLILVQPLKNECLSSEKFRALIMKHDQRRTVRNYVFEDCFGQKYVGCRSLPHDVLKPTNSYLRVFDTQQTLSTTLKLKIAPIKEVMQQRKDDYYYAN